MSELKTFMQQLKVAAENVGDGAHKITPRIDFYCESQEKSFKVAGIEIDQTMCGCPIGVTILLERDE